MKRKIFIWASAIAVSCIAAAATYPQGTHYSSPAYIVPGTYPITLGAGYDSFGQQTSEGVYYLYFNAVKGQAYTISTSGGSSIWFSIGDQSYWDWNFDWKTALGLPEGTWVSIPSLWPEMEPDGLNYRAILRASEWDLGSWGGGMVIPDRIPYILCLSGDRGASVTVKLELGEVAANRSGSDPAHAVLITPGEKEVKKSTVNLIGGTYYFKADLEAGKKYKFGTSGGSSKSPSMLSIYPADASLSDSYTVSSNLEWTTEYDVGYNVVTSKKGTFYIVLGGVASSSITLKYQVMPSRLPSEHRNPDGSALVALKPTSEGESVECRPGWRNHPLSGYDDEVIDEQLFAVSVTKGRYYRFLTEGAPTNLVMELYDAKGNVLQSNRGFSGYDCMLACKAESSGTLWLGVCQDLADEADQPAEMAIRLDARQLTDEDGKTDAWDHEDDASEGATPLKPAIGAVGDNVFEKGATDDDPHWLGLTDYVDTFKVGVRKGLTYKFGAEIDGCDPESVSNTLAARIYALDSKGKRKEIGAIDDLSKGASFTWQENTTYFIETYVKEGQGWTCGPYRLKSLVCPAQAGTALGTLKVNIGGATFEEGATWSLMSGSKAESAAYPDGTVIPLEVGDYKVTFAKVSGWNKPDDVAVRVVANELTEVGPPDGQYADDHDSSANGYAADATLGDGFANGKFGKLITTVKPTVKGVTYFRSLWANDACDCYKFSIAANSHYAFSFKPTAKLGDARIVVYGDSALKTVIAETDSNSLTASFLCRETKGTYYVVVKHADAANPVDSQYVLTCTQNKVGSVGFGAASYKVKDNAVSVKIPVKRASGTEGRIRVRYATEALTAHPGTNYMNQSGVIEWQSGKSTTTNLVITLIPDLYAHWEEDRQFKVVLAPLRPEDVEWSDGEFVPNIGIGETVVTIQEASKKVPGTVQFCGWGDGAGAFANAKKPAFSVRAGEDAVLWLSREGGSDGEIGVTITPKKGTGAADVNFESEVRKISWADGETEPKSVRIRTIAPIAAYQAAKTFSVSVAADKSYATKASKFGPSVTVTMYDPRVTKTMETYAGSFAKADGIAVKAGKADTWYFDEAGFLRTVSPGKNGSATLTVTLTGPGKFVFQADAVGVGPGCTATCAIGKEKAFEITGKRVVKYLCKGSTKVTFTVKRDRNAADGDLYISFVPQDNNEPFLWKPLPLPEAIGPLKGEVVSLKAGLDLYWQDLGDPEIAYQFHLDTEGNKKLLGKPTALITSLKEYPGYVRDPDSGCLSCGVLLKDGQSYAWRVDTVMLDEEDGETVRLIATNATVNVFKTAAANAPLTTIGDGTDAYGHPIASLRPATENIRPVEIALVTGVAPDVGFGAAGASGTVTYSASNLPKGLSIDKKTGRITGVPTKAGTYRSIIQASVGRTAGATIGVLFTVESCGLAAGSFNGLLETADGRLLGQTDEWGNPLGRVRTTVYAASQIASLNLTSTEAGKLTAKVALGGSTYTFSGKSWDETVNPLDNGQPGVRARLTNISKFTVGKKKSVPFTNELVLVACRAGTNDWEAVDTPLAAELTMNLAGSGKTNVIEGISYSGTAVRDNSKLPQVLAAEKPFVGYYTVSLPVLSESVVVGVSPNPEGYGYLTLTIDAKGKAKLAGVLADGSTKPSASSACGFVFDNGEGEPEIRVPVYFGKGGIAFGGWIRIRASGADGVPCVRADEQLKWINGNETSTYSGDTGYSVRIEPTGGYYDTLLNLQAYYLDWRFGVEPIPVSLLPEELLGSGYSAYVAFPGLFGNDSLSIAGDAITMAKQVKTYRADDKKLLDFSHMVNPANLTFTFKRATGIYSGKFDIYVGDDVAGQESKQKKAASVSHQGVLLLSRDEACVRLPPEDGVMPGFFTLSVSLPKPGSKTSKRTWTGSYPFVIAPTAVVNDWTEEPLP